MAPPSLPIEEQDNLVAALKHGRSEAFDQLYAALHGRIFNLAARVVGDTDAAADITQEVFIKAYTRIPAHQGDLRLEPWLYRVAVNTCYDHLRRRTVRSAAPLDEIDEIADGRDEFERSQTSSAVSSALEKINPRYRTALVLKDLHGFGNAEVAETLGVSQGAANVLLFRARSAFKRAFREVAPAGSGGLSAIGLAAYLPNLPVPEWLHAAPDFASLAPVAASLVPAAAPLAHTAAPLATSALPAAEAGAGLAASVGVLAKIGGALGAKVAVGVLGVTALAGGTVAVQQAQTRDPAPAPASAAPLVTTAPVAGSSAAAGSATTADSERRRYAQGRRSAGHDGRAQAGAGANGGGQNGQSAGQAGAGGGQKNGGSGGASGGGGTQAGNGPPSAPSGQGSGSGSGSGAGTSAAGAGKGAAGGPAPTASGAGVGTQPAGDGEGAQRPGSGSQPAGNGAP